MSFYALDQNLIYTFYRQGHSFAINAEKIHQFTSQRLESSDLGDMLLFKK